MEKMSSTLDCLLMTSSTSVPKKNAEDAFEEKLAFLTNIDFIEEVKYFLGIKFQGMKHKDGNLDAYLDQEAYANHLIQTAGFID